MATDEKIAIESETIENRGRRKAVKTIVGGVGALAAYHTLPVNWSKPIIEQIFLPVHAQTSGEVVEDSGKGTDDGPNQPQPDQPQPPPDQFPISSTPDSVTTVNSTVPDEDIFILFDGVSSLTLITATTQAPPDDSMVGMDTDPGETDSWDAYAPGANWSIVSGALGINNLSGDYTMVLQRLPSGPNFTLEFTVTITDTTPGPTAEVSNVTISN